MKLGIRESVISGVVFVALFIALTTIDPRVRDRVADVFGGGVSPIGERVGDLGGALWTAIRYQSIENSPMLVFAAVGAVLTLFMLRS